MHAHQGDQQRPRSEVDPIIADRLRVTQSPDLTRRVMGRLGYMRVPARVARRRRIMRWTSRCSCLALAALAAALGLKAFQSSPEARRPAELTIPAAVGRDFQQQQERVGSFIRLLQQNPAGAVERAAEPASTTDVLDNPHDPHEIDEELNRSAIAPVRWV